MIVAHVINDENSLYYLLMSKNYPELADGKVICMANGIGIVKGN